MPDNHESRDKELLDTAIPISLTEDDEAKPVATERDAEDLTPIELDEPVEAKPPTVGSVVGSNKIRTFQQDQIHQDQWQRETNTTGTGATHCKTFFCKLRADAIHHLDDQVNEWLDKHPEYEVKFTNSTIGKLVGKISEDAIFMTVWV